MIKPTRYDLYKKAITHKPKIDKRMITVEEACLFGEWLANRFERSANGTWYARRCHADDANRVYTTKELWELYQQFLGKKPANPGSTKPFTSQ